MAALEIICLSHYLFDEKMKEMNLDDNNVENENDKAFISIIGTEECIKYWICENDKHFFKDHPNVLNLEFDDIEDNVLYNGHLFETMRIAQAEKTVDFIEDVINKGVTTIYVHCRAGLSRSRAVSEFIWRYCKENDIDVLYEDRNEYTTMLNHGVLRLFNHAYWKKHHLRFYEDENKPYPHDILEPNVRVINRERNDNAYEHNRRYGKV